MNQAGNRSSRSTVAQVFRTVQNYGKSSRPASYVEIELEPINSLSLDEPIPPIHELHRDRITSVPNSVRPEAIGDRVRVISAKLRKTRQTRLAIWAIVLTCPLVWLILTYVFHLDVFQELINSPLSTVGLIGASGLFVFVPAWVLLSLISAVAEGLRERPLVRIKIGDTVFDYHHGMSDEEFNRLIDKALKG